MFNGTPEGTVGPAEALLATFRVVPLVTGHFAEGSDGLMDLIARTARALSAHRWRPLAFECPLARSASSGACLRLMRMAEFAMSALSRYMDGSRRRRVSSTAITTIARDTAAKERTRRDSRITCSLHQALYITGKCNPSLFRTSCTTGECSPPAVTPTIGDTPGRAALPDDLGSRSSQPYNTSAVHYM